jgi:erythromycin esterase-like protein
MSNPTVLFMRRFSLIALLTAVAVPARAAAQDRDPVATPRAGVPDRHQQIADLRERVVPVRSIAPSDEDFTDLTPIAAAIGDARIVQLGEGTHGDGAAFAAKVRLVKFLHQHHGFDVLLWESGTYDVRSVDDAIRAGADPAAAARLGLISNWAESAEVLPLFEYVRNIRWFAEARYPDRKLIVWAHNGHILNASVRPDWSAMVPADTDSALKRMGAYVAERFGEGVYTVGFTAFTGEYGSVRALNPTPIRTMPSDGLEALLHELGHSHAFLDLRRLPAGHWLRQPATMAIWNYGPEVVENLPQFFDGIFFIDRMARARPTGPH